MPRLVCALPATGTLLRRGGGFALALSVALALDVGGALAEPGKISVELNKLETQEKGCRAYVVVNNAGDTAYKSVKLDLVLFQPDGIIGRRFAVDLAPLKPQKRTVKIFDIEGTACDKVGSLLINDIMECSTDAGPVENCLAGLTLSTLTNVQLTK